MLLTITTKTQDYLPFGSKRSLVHNYSQHSILPSPRGKKINNVEIYNFCEIYNFSEA